MTNVKLTHDIVKNDIYFEGSDFEFNGEQYECVEHLSHDMDDNGQDLTYIYKRKSDGKYFMITASAIRCGYEWYEYEEYVNDCELIEVEKREVTVTTWEAVK